jgi:hypothetical protein
MTQAALKSALSKNPRKSSHGAAQTKKAAETKASDVAMKRRVFISYHNVNGWKRESVESYRPRSKIETVRPPSSYFVKSTKPKAKIHQKHKAHV